MARIRSIHPGIWTDESFVEMSRDARLFFIGIWNEADDCGLLEWRPTRLKMRLAPADQIDAEAIMEEIVSFGFLVRFTRGGKEYAAVKNFRKFQRPKNPSAPILPLDDEIKAIVGLPICSTPTPDLPQPFPERAEKVEQMEDGIGGDKRKEESATAASSSAAAVEKVDEKEVERRCVQATGWQSTQGISAIVDLMGEGHSLEGRILPMLRTIAGELRNQGREPPRVWAFAMKAIRDPSRRPDSADNPVEMVWVPLGSPAWRALAARRKESYLKTMLRPGPGGEGISWPVSDLPKMGAAA
jgi:hypothetical protein